MSCETYLMGQAWLRRRDPRSRILTGLGFALVLALAPGMRVAWAGLAVGLAVAATADLPLRPVLKRLRSLNLLMLMLALMLPLSLHGEALLRLGPIGWTQSGLLLAGTIALKANAIFLVVTALISTMEPVHLGHALHRLGWPSKLVQLLVFTLRYLDELEHERHKLADALRVRCFHPRLDRHTLHAYGYALGMLLVGAFDRSERILAAMRCRGFAGHFPILDTFRWNIQDTLFVGSGILVLGALGWMAWL